MAPLSNNSPPIYVTVSALDAGHITLPEHLFITSADPSKRTTVPSLSFLIQHPSPPPGRPGTHTNLLFDLGVKRNLSGYTPSQQAHIAQRQPITTSPDCAAGLLSGGLTPATDISFIILSHVHWDHVGTPSDFSSATFLVGSGTLDLLRHGAGPLYPADLFNDDELPAERTVEFPEVPGQAYPAATEGHVLVHTATPTDSKAKIPGLVGSFDQTQWKWQPLGPFPAVLDIFGDQSVYVVDSPGHLYGHVNLLARVGAGRYVYLGGDCCHDPRILSGEKGIAMYDDGRGGARSVHVDTGAAEGMVRRVREFVEGWEGGEVEVVLAHDGAWREGNRERFWPGRL